MDFGKKNVSGEKKDYFQILAGASMVKKHSFPHTSFLPEQIKCVSRSKICSTMRSEESLVAMSRLG